MSDGRSNMPDVRRLSVRAIDVIGMAVVLVMGGSVYVLGIEPILDQRHDVHTQREVLHDERDRAEALSRSVQQLRSHLKATQRAVDRNPLQLASMSALNKRLSQMTGLATDSGLRIERIQPGQGVPGDHYHTVPIKLAGRGEFRACTRFFHALHGSFPDVAINSLSLTSREDRAETTAAPSFDLTLLWYAAPPTDSRQNRERG